MAQIIPPNEAAIDILIRDLINTSCDYKYDNEDAKWTHKALKTLINSDEISAETLYRGLALLNRNSLCGRFALTFNELFYNAVVNRDIQNILIKSPFPEAEDNSQLTDKQREFLKQSLQLEMLSINLVLDYVSKMEELPQTILRSDLYRNCFKEICISNIINEDKKHANAEIISEEKISPFLSLIPKTIFVSTSVKIKENHSNQTPTKYTWCFGILELIAILATTKINPYTREYFDDDLLNRLTQTYDLEIKMYRRFLKR